MENIVEGIFTVAVTKETNLTHEDFDAKYEEMEYEVELYITFPDGSREKFDVNIHNFKIEDFYKKDE